MKKVKIQTLHQMTMSNMFPVQSIILTGEEVTPTHQVPIIDKIIYIQQVIFCKKDVYRNFFPLLVFVVNIYAVESS